MRVGLRYKVLPYIDDFLVVALPPVQLSSIYDVRGAHVKHEVTLQYLVLLQMAGKECWDGSQMIEHLGFLIDKKEMRV